MPQALGRLLDSRKLAGRPMLPSRGPIRPSGSRRYDFRNYSPSPAMARLWLLGQHRLAGPCKALCTSRLNREPTRTAGWAAQDRRRPEPTFAAAGLGAAAPPGAGRGAWPAGPPPPGRAPSRRRTVVNLRAWPDSSMAIPRRWPNLRRRPFDPHGGISMMMVLSGLRPSTLTCLAWPGLYGGENSRLPGLGRGRHAAMGRAGGA
jgi:hypothetical protein